jgi:hypothetical protein
MKILIPLVFLTLTAFATIVTAQSTPPPGATLVTKVEWQPEALPPGMKLVDGRSSLVVEKTADAPTSYPVWHKSQPGVQTKCYALRGSLRYQSIQGIGYMELWNQFPGTPEPARYFSRTLAEAGPMKKISGDSDWRTVWIPFDGTESKVLPERLDLNLVLPATGTVELSNFELYQFADAGAMWAAVAESVNTTQRPPSPFSGTGRMILILAGLLAIYAIITATIKRRRHLERRRMRAMDRG